MADVVHDACQETAIVEDALKSSQDHSLDAKVATPEKKAAAKPKGAAKGRGKGKAKIKAKGKGRGKCRRQTKRGTKAKLVGRKTCKRPGAADAAVAANSSAKSDEVGQGAKKQKLSLKMQVVAELGDRNIDHVLAEVRDKIASYESSIATREAELQAADTEVDNACQELEGAIQTVEDAKGKEAAALKKLQELLKVKDEAARSFPQARANQIDPSSMLKILELESDNQRKLEELEQARRTARETAEAATKALEDSKRKEKEATDAVKKLHAEQSDKENALLKETGMLPADGKREQKQAKNQRKVASKTAAAEIAVIEKARAAREKDRQAKIDAETGMGKGKRKQKFLAVAAPAESTPLVIDEAA